uniref:Uncharacterized protein n=1 Tax=Caenorhabditis japonica TaxID=281687 RepID=A0A8R1E8R3_CAEJA
MGRRAIVLKDTVPKDTVLKFSIQRVVVPKDPSYPKKPYPKSSRTQRAIVPKDTVPKIGTQRVAVPKDPSYPKSLGPKDPGPTEYWPCPMPFARESPASCDARVAFHLCGCAGAVIQGGCGFAPQT